MHVVIVPFINEHLFRKSESKNLSNYFSFKRNKKHATFKRGNLSKKCQILLTVPTHSKKMAKVMEPWPGTPLLQVKSRVLGWLDNWRAEKVFVVGFSSDGLTIISNQAGRPIQSCSSRTKEFFQWSDAVKPHET